MTNVMVIGPCVAESLDLMKQVADHLLNIWDKNNLTTRLFLKGSFDKANRTSIDGRRGPGIVSGLHIFNQLKELYPTLPLITDIHETTQPSMLRQSVDALQIPAFLCKQTDLLVEAGNNCPIVNVKKGQWVAPKTCAEIPGKVRAGKPEAEVWICERGTFLGYDQLVVDFRAARSLTTHFDEVLMDATHATQYVSGGRTLGDPDLAARYFKAAPLFGYTGVFAEVHPDPLSSPSDATSMIQLEAIEDLILANLDIAAKHV